MSDNPIRIVLMLPQSNRIVTREGLLRAAEAAEALQFYGVSVRDHISFNGAWISSGMRGIKAAGDDRDFLESMQTLAYVAAATHGGPGICLSASGDASAPRSAFTIILFFLPFQSVY